MQELLDEREIRDVILRYCRGIDRMEVELVRSCYHPDATDEHGSFSGGVDEFLAWVWPLLQRYTMTMHFVGNLLVEVAGLKPFLVLPHHRGAMLHLRLRQPFAQGSDDSF